MLKHFSLPLLASIVIILSSYISFPRNRQPTTNNLQPGCHYQQVQCIRAPCDPILVCPTPPSGVTGTLSVPTPTCTPRPKCLDANPRCLMPETPDMCGALPKPTAKEGPPTTYTCPPSGWVDCMPGPGPAKPQCQKEYLDWIKVSCPDFQGVAY